MEADRGNGLKEGRKGGLKGGPEVAFEAGRDSQSTAVERVVGEA